MSGTFVHVQGIVKEVPTNAPWPDVAAIPREFTGNYEMAALRDAGC
jgi:hypothetical protein